MSDCITHKMYYGQMCKLNSLLSWSKLDEYALNVEAYSVGCDLKFSKFLLLSLLR